MEYMIPNDERPCLEQQDFIIRAINELGFNPCKKPIHLYTLDELKAISNMYNEGKES
jgi:hypothetical protein